MASILESYEQERQASDYPLHMQLAGDPGAAFPTPSFELAAAEIAAGADRLVVRLHEAPVLHLLVQQIYFSRGWHQPWYVMMQPS
jgi:3-deoxy-D-arabino-heptulosonate 7-phosphate (DAHP) synthase